jgi:hypothetical protein
MRQLQAEVSNALGNREQKAAWIAGHLANFQV